MNQVSKTPSRLNWFALLEEYYFGNPRSKTLALESLKIEDIVPSVDAFNEEDISLIEEIIKKMFNLKFYEASYQAKFLRKLQSLILDYYPGYLDKISNTGSEGLMQKALIIEAKVKYNSAQKVKEEIFDGLEGRIATAIIAGGSNLPDIVKKICEEKNDEVKEEANQKIEGDGKVSQKGLGIVLNQNFPAKFAIFYRDYRNICSQLDSDQQK